MEKILISLETYFDDGHPITAEDALDYVMVDAEDIETCDWWNGEEGVYVYDGDSDEMELLSDMYTQDSDGLRYFIKEEGWNRGDGWLTEDDFKQANRVRIKRWEGTADEYEEVFVEITDSVSHNNYRHVEVEHGINSTDIVLSDPDGYTDGLHIERTVDVEIVDTTPMDYPQQPFETIYEGTDEDGRHIRITETHPFYEDESYPVCRIELIEDEA